MKAFCVAVLVLNFISVCQSSSVACERYLKTADREQDLTGKWYLIAMSSNSCWATAFSVLPFGIYVNITAMEEANIYESTFSLKMFGQCKNLTSKIHYEKSTITEIDSKGAKSDNVMILLKRRCHDCIVIKGDGFTDILVLLSKRMSITDDEMEAFEIQAECRYLYKPQIFGSDHDFENCTVDDGKTEYASSEIPHMRQAVLNIFSQVFTCAQDRVLYYPRAAFRWVQSTWSNLW
ncbi:uncharacterized protein LOC120718615 [Simochromis diagramma]|uniref:uncharacterized protein LOC120718615 n=1 Tax=Simochromis diagramma TaxID=43689 RepID=UPI001A7EF5D0|nr:uncharacterized protein LOC120718615 [Simochromis diagramma]